MTAKSRINDWVANQTGFRVVREPVEPRDSKKDSEYYIHEDGLRTLKNLAHLRHPDFTHAYNSAVSTCGWDYRIRWRTHTVLWAAKHSLNTEGEYLELGTGRGWMCSAVCEYTDILRTQKTMYCIDRFLPNAVDPMTGSVLPGENTAQAYYAKSLAETTQSLARYGARVRLIQGEIPSALTELPEAPIAFCHVDLNAAQPEVDALKALWPRLSRGAIVILDDFGWPAHDLQHDAHQALAKELNYEILSIPTGQGLIFKP